MKYHTYKVSIATSNGLKFLEIVAIDLQSAHADIREAYSEDVVIVNSSIV